MRRTDSLEKTLNVGKTESRRRRGWQSHLIMVGWHHQLSGHAFEQTLGDSEGQGSLVCCVHGISKSWTQLRDWTRTRTEGVWEPLTYSQLVRSTDHTWDFNWHLKAVGLGLEKEWESHDIREQVNWKWGQWVRRRQGGVPARDRHVGISELEQSWQGPGRARLSLQLWHQS